MLKKWLNPERVVSIMGFLFLSVALFASLHLELHTKTIIPSQNIVRIVHGICVACTFFSIFKPLFIIQISVMVLESILTILTGYEQLGLFLFYGALVLMFVKGFFTVNGITKITILGIFHLLAILGISVKGWIFVVLTAASSIFYAAFFACIYDILKVKLSCFMPSKVTYNEVLVNLAKGSKLHLLDYTLSSRQADFILDNLHSNCSYKDLSEKYFVSISTVKKDFSEIFKIFGVTKLEELHILLLQYQVVK